MVDFSKIIQKLEKDDGPVKLFVVAQMDELIDSWTVLFSATWVTEKNGYDVYKKISDLIDADPDKEDASKVARLSILSSDHYLVGEILNYKGDSELKDTKINGNIFHTGTIYRPSKG